MDIAVPALKNKLQYLYSLVYMASDCIEFLGSSILYGFCVLYSRFNSYKTSPEDEKHRNTNPYGEVIWLVINFFLMIYIFCLIRMMLVFCCHIKFLEYAWEQKHHTNQCCSKANPSEKEEKSIFKAIFDISVNWLMVSIVYCLISMVVK